MASNNTTAFLGNATLQETQGYIAESMASVICKVVALTIIAMVALVGNSLVICTVWKTYRMRTVTNYLIVNMSVADILYVVIIMPPTYVQMFGLFKWAFRTRARGIYFCQVINFGQYLLVPVSVLTLATIAADRFFAIVLPMKKVITKQVFRVLLLVIWIVAAGLASPTLYAYRRRMNPLVGFHVCNEEWTPAFDDATASKTYSMMLFVVAYCVPFLLMSIMYSVICRALWLRKIPGEQDDTKGQKAQESRKKVVKMLITVVIFFVICWLPVQIVTFQWDYSEINVSSDVDFICKLLMRSHSAVSPCIYAIFSQNYRQGFKKILTCGRCGSDLKREEYSVSYSATREALVRRSMVHTNGGDRRSSPHIQVQRNSRLLSTAHCGDRLKLANYDQLRRNSSRMQHV